MIENRRLNSEDLAQHVRIKKYKMLFLYHFRYFWKKIYIRWPFILFVFSLVLFLSVLIPNIFLHKLPILGEWPMVLKLHGIVLIEMNHTNASSSVGVRGALIEIGGYKCVTDQEGKFQIKFVSKLSNNIPVIIQYSSKIIIKRVSFEFNQFEKMEVFILNDN